MRRIGLLIGLLVVFSACGPDPVPQPSPVPRPISTLTLSGTVTETAPTQSTPIAAATVTIVTGPLVGKFATADANGAFQLAAPPGDVLLVVRAANHVERYEQVAVGGTSTIAFELDPVSQTMTSTLNGTITGSSACPDYWDFVSGDPCGADYVINVHSDGTLSAELTWADTDVSLVLQLYRSRNGKLLERLQTANGQQQLSQTVEAHSQYVLHVQAFSNGGGPPPSRVTSHSLVVTHPN